ncbi:hypothetical protein P4V86_10965 [Brevibacillus laterosporus]|uniref:hypothetical protein n=1 Tax=Brevibacillus laterosporus TaxID=1465 RepID=UPI000367389E|nr:hypothetical protein [Brevibacillus laterosporus]ATO48075.1 hypothetical protein BrL25_02485 [Brevibacillus laterosporus DSM 25]MBG9801739.1 hypothetical protein [Brevibacillus laterosporus]MED2003869.1 hypothetical protein [Brevibacillus laterosporus]MED4762467.1 hypothetical protein [Brevibacillus laterosporus]
MEVIGIVQTDMNEFSILFEPDKKQQQDQQGNQNGAGQNYQDHSHDDDDNDFLNFLGGDVLQETGNSRDNKSQQQNEPQEMVVRIKGIPEGQKATFLQMYQIVTDAKQQTDLEQQLTIVSIENTNDQQNQQGNQNQQQQDKSPKKSSKDQNSNQKAKNKQQYQ